MKILVVDDSKALDLSLKLQANGHEVRYVNNAAAGDNLIVKYTSWKDRIGWADMVVFTGHSNPTYVEVLKRKDKSVIGVPKFLAQLKDDIVFRNQILTGLKLTVAEHEYFTNYDDAIQYLNEERSYTLKPLSSELPIYKAESAQDMSAMLNYMKTTKQDPEFIIEKTPTGLPIECGAWFNGFKFVRPIANIVGNALRFTKTNRLFGEALIYLEPYLKNSRYTGYIGLRCVVDNNDKVIDDVVYGFQMPHYQMQDQIVKEDWGSFLFNLTQGSLSAIKVMPRWCYSIKVSSGNVPIFLEETEKFSHLVDCARIGNHLHSVGDTPLITCGHAMTIKEAHRRALEVADTVCANNKMYDRTEPIELSQYKQLKKWGYMDVSG